MAEHDIVIDEEEEGYDPSLEIFDGCFVILDREQFINATNALAIHVTEEKGVHILVDDGGTLTWQPFAYKEAPKKKTSLFPAK